MKFPFLFSRKEKTSHSLVIPFKLLYLYMVDLVLFFSLHLIIYDIFVV